MKKLTAIIITLSLLILSLTSCISIDSIVDHIGDITDIGNVGNAPSPETDDLDHRINVVGREAVLSGVVVSATHYSGFQKKEAQGSGVIYRIYERYFYVLTNYHVAYSEGTKVNSIYTITDAFDVSHNASLVAADETKDLAVLRFVAGNDDIERLLVVSLATSNLSVSSTVLAVGNPAGLHNAISIGDLIAYNDVELDALSIPVMYHTAPVDHGSSGGGVYNSDGELVGINYAIGQSDEGENTISFAVPIESVIEFLGANGILPVVEDVPTEDNGNLE